MAWWPSPRGIAHRCLALRRSKPASVRSDALEGKHRAWQRHRADGGGVHQWPFWRRFPPGLARTSYPLLACGVATKHLPPALLDVIDPARVAMSQHPLGLYPLVFDGRNRLAFPGLALRIRASAISAICCATCTVLGRRRLTCRSYSMLTGLV